uniref:ZNF677_0 protein n=1 Tax=Fopius arisanus TaxID=64838 RepID=A0A0C9QNI9_9HYME
MMGGTDNSCRLCLGDFDDNLLSIFSNSISDGPSLSTKIMICLSLPIEPDNSFSTKICQDCHQEISRFYDFRDKCLRTHYNLSRSRESCNNSESCLINTKTGDSSASDSERVINQEVGSPQPLLPSSSEIKQDQTIPLKPESQNTIYEYKCLHCNSLFPDLDAASVHCMQCSDAPRGIDLSSENVNLKNQTPDNGDLKDSIQSGPEESAPPPSKPPPRAKKNNKVECSECSHKFLNASLLKRHMSVHTGERPFTCETCNRKFSQLGQLNFHRKFHVNPRYRCQVCEKPFLRPSDIEKHMRTHTGEKPFACKICDKSFAQLVALKLHERVHTGDKPYVCEICGKKFSQKANKTKHLKIHKEGMKPHTCGVCGRSFHEHEEMVLHRAGHGGGKPRKCDHCDERFRKLSELTDHVRRYHTFERPHKCAFCSKAFYSLYNLKQHVMIHTGQKPFPCGLCQLKFTQKGNLMKHYERKHKTTGPISEDNDNIKNDT